MRATHVKQDGLKTKDSRGTEGKGGLAGIEPRPRGTHSACTVSPLKMKAQETAECRKPRAPREDNKFPWSCSVILKFYVIFDALLIRTALVM